MNECQKEEIKLVYRQNKFKTRIHKKKLLLPWEIIHVKFGDDIFCQILKDICNLKKTDFRKMVTLLRPTLN